ncbi:MAG: glucosamine inositolphosphorylceramide transferase family protein, partial [Gaiellaceae bacterium]
MDPAGATVLYRSQSFVRRLSLQRARNPIYWKSAAFVARALQPGAATDGTMEAGADCSPPTVRELAALQWRLGRRLCSFLHERLFHRPSWSIDWRAGSWRTESSDQFVPGGRLEPPRGEFYADPFVVDRDGRHYLFYEAYRHSLGRAELAVRELVDGAAGPATTIMARPHHLSYPFVFRWRDDHFLLPESAESGLVQLYRAVDFPGEWCLDTTLLEGVRAYDSTLVEHGGRYFLFAAIPEHGADIDELHLFWADDLRGPYRPHPQNPVVSDASRARPAGRVFTDAGRLIRPSQDGSRGYGSAIVLNEIVRLDPAGYAEQPAGRIEANWDARAHGTHTIDHD